MPKFTDRELFIAQIIGGITVVITLITGTIGNICLKTETGVPEYMICLKNSSWTLMIVAFLWIGLATWRRVMKSS